MTLVVIMLHVFWGVVFFDGCEKNKWYTLLTVLLTHLVVSTQVSAGTVLGACAAQVQTSEWWVPPQLRDRLMGT